jgi:hypothetical protein
MNTKILFFTLTLLFAIKCNAQTPVKKGVENENVKDNINHINFNGNGFYEKKGQILDQNYNPNPGVKYLLNRLPG